MEVLVNILFAVSSAIFCLSENITLETPVGTNNSLDPWNISDSGTQDNTISKCNNITDSPTLDSNNDIVTSNSVTNSGIDTSSSYYPINITNSETEVESNNNFSPLVVTDSGVAGTPTPKDVMVALFVSVVNAEQFTVVSVSAKKKQCCLRQAGTNGCQDIRLVEDSVEMIEPGKKACLTLVYPSFYTYKLEGVCIVSISYYYMRQLKVLDHSVHFNTSARTSWIQVIKDWVYGISICSNPDSDATRECEPVNCLMKYHGTRNNFNHTTEMCEDVPECIAPDRQNLPTKVLNYRTNKCEDLKPSLTKADVKNFITVNEVSPFIEIKNVSSYYFRCTNGRVSTDMSTCVCDEGWHSDQYDPVSARGQTHDMCDQRDNIYTAIKGYTGLSEKQLQIMILVMYPAFTIVSILLGITCWHNRKLKKSSIKPPPQGDELDAAILAARKLHPKYRGVVPYEFARVYIPNAPLFQDDLLLQRGDLITNMEMTENPGIWRGLCNEKSGTFPVQCARFYMPGVIVNDEGELQNNG